MLWWLDVLLYHKLDDVMSWSSSVMRPVVCSVRSSRLHAHCICQCAVYVYGVWSVCRLSMYVVLARVGILFVRDIYLRALHAVGQCLVGPACMLTTRVAHSHVHACARGKVVPRMRALSLRPASRTAPCCMRRPRWRLSTMRTCSHHKSPVSTREMCLLAAAFHYGLGVRPHCRHNDVCARRGGRQHVVMSMWWADTGQLQPGCMARWPCLCFIIFSGQGAHHPVYGACAAEKQAREGAGGH